MIDKDASKDSKSSQAISKRMRGVKSASTKPELLVRQYLHGQGFRYRLHSACLPGRPDIILPKYKTVVFIHGCFWHQHDVGCGKRITPAENLAYWKPKLARNVQRDQENQQALTASGWQVLVIWECELKRASRGATLAHLTTAILGSELRWEVVEAELGY